MSTRKGTGCFLALFLAFSLLCSVSLVAQDKLLTVTAINPSANTKVADPTSVNCLAYALDGVTCVAGQYYHSDNTRPNSVWTATATGTTFGNWIEGNGSSSGCLSCHHGSITTAGRGGGYLVGGHKNILRKIVPGQTLFDTTGNSVLNVVDHSGNPFTLSQTAGTISGTLGTFPALYLAGWTNAEDVFGTGSTLAYGSCARCHTTGYRPDNKAPEPTAVTGTYPTLTYTPLTDAQFSRIPVGAGSGTSSWSLTGIQCERCHKADMQYDATVVNPNIGTVAAPSLSAGRISHFNNIIPTSVTANATTGVITGTDFYMSTAVTATAATRPLPIPPTALTCLECHQAYSTWNNKITSQVGQVHITPLPGFEGLATPLNSGYTSTKLATGQFSATWGCTINGVAVAGIKTNDYAGCVAAGGTVTYVPGGMSHGAVATILNSPHALVSGYVDIKNPGTADNTLTIIGGTTNVSVAGVATSVNVAGKYNSHFASKGTADQGAPAGVTGATNGVTGSCAGCHDIHGAMPTYTGFTPPAYAPVDATNISGIGTNSINTTTAQLVNCTSCHASHGNAMNHPTGPGTPFAAVNGSAGGFGSQESCSTCHFSKKTGTKYHFLRINPDPNYTTFPTAQQYYTAPGSGQFGKLNTYNAGDTYTDANGATQVYPAVALDVDIACGQCHTGGTGASNPYGLTPYPGDGGVAPRPYSRAFLAAAAVSMHNTNAAAPTFNVALPSTGAPTSITITSSSISEGTYASIFYTTDGTTPTASVNVAEQYVPGGTTIEAAGPTVTIPVTATTTIYAFAAGPASYSFTPSAVVGGTYGVQPAPTATIAPTGAALTYPATVSVKLTDAAGSVCYTTNGAVPTVTGTTCSGTSVASGTSITVGSSMVIKAVGYGSNYGVSSVVATATFTVTPPTPAWSNVAPAKFPGTYTGAVTAALTDTDVNASICYTTNGATPVVPCNGTTVASGAAITVSASETIKAIAIDGTAASKATSGTFVIH